MLMVRMKVVLMQANDDMVEDDADDDGDDDAGVRMVVW